MPHTQAHVRVQWVANPLSVHVHIVLFSRVDQIRDTALHRIELQTSRFYNPTLSTTEPRGRWNYNSNHSKYSKELRVHSYSEAGRPRWFTNATGRKFKMNSEIVHKNKFTCICAMCCPLSKRRPILLLHLEQRAAIETITIILRTTRRH